LSFAFVFAMLARSFRLVGSRLTPSRLIPGPFRAKQARTAGAALGCILAAGALAALVAACGSSSPAASTQRVDAAGFRFQAPSGWSVERTRLAVTAAHGGELVQVSTFPLTKRYRAALYEKVGPELRAQLERAAAPVHGKVEEAGDVTVDGVRAHVYRLRVGDRVDEYTFVLVGRREYQLLCRAPEAGAAPCRQLQETFELA
jgi:hypothetical protein